MKTNAEFNEMLMSVLAKTLEDDKTQAEVNRLFAVHREKLRDICASPNGHKVRVPLLEAADSELLIALESLTDTEPDKPTTDAPQPAAEKRTRKKQ